MTTVTESDFRGPSAFGRIVNVLKLNLVNPWTTITFPWIVLAIVFLLNMSIWGILAYSIGADKIEDGLQYSGATTWIFVYMTVVAVQAVNLTFPFAQGYGVTRRDFWLGASLNFVLLAIMYSVGMAILSVIEDATNGWGFGGRMFTAVYFGENWMQRLFIFFALFIFFFFLGATIAAVYVRWKATGVTLFFAVLGVATVGGAALLTFTDNWAIVGNFFEGAGLVGAFAWSLVVSAIAWLAGLLIIRRATPKS